MFKNIFENIFGLHKWDDMLESVNKTPKTTVETKDLSSSITNKTTSIELVRLIKPNAIAHIDIILCDNSDIVVVCDWISQDPRVAESYGQLINHAVTNLGPTILDILTRHQNNNPDSAEFIEEVLRTWSEIKTSKAAILPSQVFKVMK